MLKLREVHWLHQEDKGGKEQNNDKIFIDLLPKTRERLFKALM